MERETGFEPATPALARQCSTTELFPQEFQNATDPVGVTSKKVTLKRGDVNNHFSCNLT